MDDLIKALQIFRQYGNPTYPTVCAHDMLIVLIKPSTVPKAAQVELDALGFTANEEDENFYSFKFGSA